MHRDHKLEESGSVLGPCPQPERESAWDEKEASGQPVQRPASEFCRFLFLSIRSALCCKKTLHPIHASVVFGSSLQVSKDYMDGMRALNLA
jgi:hypothetical protein